jgi:PAS domain-containing protein
MNSSFIKSPESLNLDPQQVIRVFDLMPDLVYVINLQEQNLLYANDRLYDILGYTWDDVAQMNYSLGPGIIHENKDSFRVSITETFNNLVEDK